MILIIDDHQDTRDMLAHMLMWDGMKSVGVESGPAALEWLRCNTAHLIILDFSMPQMDGLEVLKRLKANEAHRPIPVLFFSAYADEVKQQAIEAGAADVIQKGSLDWLLLGSQVYKHLRPSGGQPVRIAGQQPGK